MKKKKINWWIIIALIILLIDQITKVFVIKYFYNSSKILVPNVLNLTYVENTGAAFGIGSNSTIMFVIVNIIIIGLITYFIYAKKEDISNSMLFSLHLVLAGGIGNLIDRIFRGFVVDYIDINPLFKFPVFNFADVCITIGCAIVIIQLTISVIKERKKL